MGQKWDSNTILQAAPKSALAATSFISQVEPGLLPRTADLVRAAKPGANDDALQDAQLQGLVPDGQ